VEAHQSPARSLVEGVVIQKPPRPGDRSPIVAPELQQLGEPLGPSDEDLAQPIALGRDPVVVAVGKQIARVEAECVLQRPAFIGLLPGLPGHFGSRDPLLELGHVERGGSVASPAHDSSVDLQEPLGLGHRATKEVQRLSQVGASLRFLGIGPEEVSEPLTGQTRVAVEHEIRDQRLQPRGVDGGGRLALEREPESAEQLHPQGRPCGPAGIARRLHGAESGTGRPHHIPVL
jgi:hypothetical protein